MPRNLIASAAVATALAALPAVSAAASTTLGTVPGTDQRVSALGDVIAVADAGGPPIVDEGETPPFKERRLWISVSGGPFEVAEQSKPLGIWGRPNVGTDRKGRTVVVYPTCKNANGTSCDLRVYDVASGRDEPLRAVNTKTRDEAEGVMDRGAVIVAREVWSVGDKPDRDLFYRPVGGSLRKVVGFYGSSGLIDLDRGRILVAEDADEALRCGKDIRLARIVRPKQLLDLAAPRCRGEDKGGTFRVTLHGDYAYWARDLAGITRFERRSIFGGPVQHAAVTANGISDFEVLSPTSVLVTRGGNPTSIVKLTGLRWKPGQWGPVGEFQ